MPLPQVICTLVDKLKCDLNTVLEWRVASQQHTRPRELHVEEVLLGELERRRRQKEKRGKRDGGVFSLFIGRGKGGRWAKWMLGIWCLLPWQPVCRLQIAMLPMWCHRFGRSWCQHMEVKGQYWCLPPSFYLVLWARVSHWTCSSSIGLNWLAIELHESTCFCSQPCPSAGVRLESLYPVFYVAQQVTLPTEPSRQSWVLSLGNHQIF